MRRTIHQETLCWASSTQTPPQVSTIWADCCKPWGELATAKPYDERALAIFEKRFGLSHRYTKVVRNNLVSLFEQLEESA